MDKAKLVAIHQPNFFPWLGYFNKIASSGVFVVLDNVQFQKKGGTWCNRVKMRVGAEAEWVTMPVDRAYHGFRDIREMQIAPQPWRQNLLASLRRSYAAAPHFAEAFAFLEPLISNPVNQLSEYNLSAIRALLARLRIDSSRLVVGSSLSVQGDATDLLIGIVRAVGGKAYLYGGGSGGYQEDEKFAAAGLGLVPQEFKHPAYPQAGGSGFTPGLSIVDALMNVGFDATRELVMASRPPGI